MGDEPSPDATQLLADLHAGDRRAADRLLPLVYEEFRRLAGRYMRQERADHTLDPTALVHEVYLKLIEQHRVTWKGRTHFHAVAAQAMRRILIDHARRHKRQKRGGVRHRVVLSKNIPISPNHDEDLIALDEAMEKLAALDSRQAKVVELRFFGGLTVEEVAKVLDVSKRTVEGDWQFARAWLKRALSIEGETK